MRIFMIIFYLLLIFIGAGFAALNSASIKINLLLFSFTLPISVLVIISIVLGVLLGYLVTMTKYLRLKVAQHEIKNKLKLSEKEIKNLRSIPLKDRI